jgi:hypothetical protein
MNTKQKGELKTTPRATHPRPPRGQATGYPGGATGKGFMPGQSGNPGGRPTGVKDMTQLARAHTVDAIRALVAALQKPRERVAAATALLDRGWGKPVQMITGDANQPLVVDFRWADSTPVVASPAIETQPAPIVETVWREIEAQSDTEPVLQSVLQFQPTRNRQ